MQGVGSVPLDVSQSVADHPEFATGRHGGILLPQRPRRAVARVGEGRLAVFDERGVERLEIVESEEHLAAHLEDVGHRVIVAGRQPFGYIVDGARVERDILAGAPVAAGRGPNQSTVAVDQSQRDTIDLELTQERNVGTDFAVNATGPQVEFLGAEHVVQRQHSLQMVGGGEIRGEAGTADELGRRIRRAEFGMLVFKCGQAA